MIAATSSLLVGDVQSSTWFAPREYFWVAADRCGHDCGAGRFGILEACDVHGCAAATYGESSWVLGRGTLKRKLDC